MSRSAWLTLLLVSVGILTAAQVLVQSLGLIPTLVLFGVIGVLLLVGHAIATGHPVAFWLAENRLTLPLVRLICWLGAMPLPRRPSNAPPAERRAVRTAAEFDALVARLKETVLGQEAAVATAVESLRQSLTLWGRTATENRQGPAAVLLLTGGEGLGKRTLLELLGRAVFPVAAVKTLDLTATTDAIAALRRLPIRPEQTLILEHVDQASPKVAECIRHAIESGEWPDSVGEPSIRFDGCLLGLTATTMTGFGPAFLAAVGPPIPFVSPDALAVAQVVVRLMADECRRYSLALDYADESTVARLVAGFDPTHGFRTTAATVGELLSPEIFKAIEGRHDRLAFVEE